MRILIKATNIELSDALRIYTEEKLAGLEKFLRALIPARPTKEGERDPIELRVEIGKPSQHHKRGNVFLAELTVALPGRASLRAEAMREDLRVAIDEAHKELTREIKHYKNRFFGSTRRKAREQKTRAQGL